MNWTAKMDGHDVSATTEQLASFKAAYVGDSDLASRMSQLLMFDMYVLDREFGVSPHAILDAIKNVEQGEPHNGVKPATMFRNPPLNGLWHKHYFSAEFLLQNIALSLGKNGLEKLISDVFVASKPTVTKEMIEELAHRFATEPAEQREQAGKLTGEWVIFAKHEGKKYYLAVNTHGAGDQFIFDRIMEHCVKEFPDLPAWI
jgi:hypothetical protein